MKLVMVHGIAQEDRDRESLTAEWTAGLNVPLRLLPRRADPGADPSQPAPAQPAEGSPDSVSVLLKVYDLSLLPVPDQSLDQDGNPLPLPVGPTPELEPGARLIGSCLVNLDQLLWAARRQLGLDANIVGEDGAVVDGARITVFCAVTAHDDAHEQAVDANIREALGSEQAAAAEAAARAAASAGAVDPYSTVRGFLTAPGCELLAANVRDGVDDDVIDSLLALANGSLPVLMMYLRQLSRSGQRLALVPALLRCVELLQTLGRDGLQMLLNADREKAASFEELLRVFQGRIAQKRDARERSMLLKGLRPIVDTAVDTAHKRVRARLARHPSVLLSLQAQDLLTGDHIEQLLDHASNDIAVLEQTFAAIEAEVPVPDGAEAVYADPRHLVHAVAKRRDKEIQRRKRDREALWELLTTPDKDGLSASSSSSSSSCSSSSSSADAAAGGEIKISRTPLCSLLAESPSPSLRLDFGRKQSDLICDVAHAGVLLLPVVRDMIADASFRPATLGALINEIDRRATLALVGGKPGSGVAASGDALLARYGVGTPTEEEAAANELLPAHERQLFAQYAAPRPASASDAKSSAEAAMMGSGGGLNHDELDRIWASVPSLLALRNWLEAVEESSIFALRRCLVEETEVLSASYKKQLVSQIFEHRFY